MHFRLVKIPNSEFTGIVMFDSKEFKPEDFSLEDIKEITLDELKTTYQDYPLLSLSDFLLRSLNPKLRTSTHVLSECNIECYRRLEFEKTLIDSKKSKLSASQRDMVITYYNNINNTK